MKSKVQGGSSAIKIHLAHIGTVLISPKIYYFVAKHLFVTLLFSSQPTTDTRRNSSHIFMLNSFNLIRRIQSHNP